MVFRPAPPLHQHHLSSGSQRMAEAVNPSLTLSHMPKSREDFVYLANLAELAEDYRGGRVLVGRVPQILTMS